MNTDKKVLTKLFLLLIPVAYASYLFHEFGHWIIGEVLGNEMAYSLNYVWPKDGHYINENHYLYVLIGGPAFTILLAILSLLIIEKYNTIYVYPLTFFQFFLRFFSLFFGGFGKQDEAKISAVAGLGTYIVAVIVLLILLLIVLRAGYKLKINLKDNLKFFAFSTLAQLLVIATYEIMEW
jgi:hypothetical protein